VEEELLMMIQDLARRETRLKAQARILRQSEFQKRVLGQTVIAW